MLLEFELQIVALSPARKLFEQKHKLIIFNLFFINLIFILLNLLINYKWRKFNNIN